jgi:hypothetical protein
MQSCLAHRGYERSVGRLGLCSIMSATCVAGHVCVFLQSQIRPVSMAIALVAVMSVTRLAPDFTECLVCNVCIVCERCPVWALSWLPVELNGPEYCLVAYMQLGTGGACKGVLLSIQLHSKKWQVLMCQIDPPSYSCQKVCQVRLVLLFVSPCTT